MEVQPYRHRHFIALPAFLLIAGMSVANIHTSVFSSLTSSLSQQASLLPDGMYGTVTDATLHNNGVLELVSGSALLGGTGIATVQMGDMQITFFDGAVHLTKNDSSITIAAITSPVFVAYRDERMVVPIGMQWTTSGSVAPLADGFVSWIEDRTPTPLPQHFFEQQILSIKKVKDDVTLSLPELRDELPLGTQAIEAFLLPTSRQIAQQKRVDDILGYIRFVIEQEDRQNLLIASAQPEVNAVLHTSRGIEVLTTLLSSLDPKTPLAMDILSILADNESTVTVALFHPKYRDIAWSFMETDATIESRLTRAFIFPYSLYTPTPVSDFVFDRYRLTIEDIGDTVADSTTFIENVYDAHYPFIAKLQAKGYPQRAAHMRRSLIYAIESIETQTDTMKKDLAQLQVGNMVDVSPLPQESAEIEQKEKQEVQKADVPSLSPAEIENRAYAVLQDAGALFTVETNIAALMANTARISGVYFSGSTEDRKATFSLNVVTGIVSDIEVNEQSDFPYNPSFEGFKKWISR